MLRAKGFFLGLLPQKKTLFTIFNYLNIFKIVFFYASAQQPKVRKVKKNRFKYI